MIFVVFIFKLIFNRFFFVFVNDVNFNFVEFCKFFDVCRKFRRLILFSRIWRVFENYLQKLFCWRQNNCDDEKRRLRTLIKTFDERLTILKILILINRVRVIISIVERILRLKLKNKTIFERLKKFVLTFVLFVEKLLIDKSIIFIDIRVDNVEKTFND